ncbi:MAG: GNAT family N-acetyltransferase [Taibaiella sp.]|nr:GNAT family N-acetyltransferase [Taibaiella sp.]
MEGSLVYRRAVTADLDGLHIVSKNSFGQYKDHLTEEGWQQLNTNLQNKSRIEEIEQKAQIVVCCDGATIVGMAFLVPHGNPDDIYDESWCHLRMVGVLPGYGGRGIGKKLTEMCIQQARENGETTMALHTSELMHAARHIYESLGFTILKEIPARFGMRYWLYTKQL